MRPLKSVVIGNFPRVQRNGPGKLPEIRFQGTAPRLHDTQGCITSGLATILPEPGCIPRTIFDE